MIRNYLITALRNLKRNKVYTFLNILGLALGIGCSLVIYKVIEYEYSYDQHEPNYEKIYRLVHLDIYPDRTEKGQGVPHPMGGTLREEFPEMKHIVKMSSYGGDQLNVTDKNGVFKKVLVDNGFVFTENEYFQVFAGNWIAGDPSTALLKPNTVVIAASEARKLFGFEKGEEHMAMSKTVNFANDKDFEVVGVVKDPVETSSLPFTFFFNYESQAGKINPYYFDGKAWNSTSSGTQVYFIPEEGFNKDAFNARMLSFVDKYFGEGESEERQYLAQPFAEIHFDQDYGAYSNQASSELMLTLGIIAIFLILTACINFINLATAQAANRAKEIGIRKAIGGLSHQLVVQFLSEIAIITLIALLISLVISEIMFVALEDILEYKLSLDLIQNPEAFLFLFLIFGVVTLLSGAYPSVLLSRMNTVTALKKKITNNSGGLSLRKALVVVQFAISQFLIIGTLVISYQTDFFLNKDLGFNTEAIMTTYLPEQDDVKMERFRRIMLESPAIESVAYGLSEPTGNSDAKSNFNYAPLQSEKSYHGNFKAIDGDYADLFGLELMHGRMVKKTDSAQVVINRKIADLIGFKDNYEAAVGETINTGWGGNKKIVGVIENFHTYNLEEDLDYVFLIYHPKAFYSIAFKTPSMSSIAEAKTHFEQSWEQVYPEYVIDYDFYDESIKENYSDIENTTALMRIFAIIAILIGCLGLYGLVSFIAMNKTKEIGVRKVLGASVANILSIFSKEVLTLTVIAFVLTAPIAFFVLDAWLNEFAFRINLGLQVFAAGFVITLLIAILTMSHKTIAAATINPAKTLKDD